MPRCRRNARRLAVAERTERNMDSEPTLDWEFMEATVDRYGGNPEALLMILQDISEHYRYVPPPVIPWLAHRLGVSQSRIYGVATFYKSISLEPRGKYVIHVCLGTACHVRGADRVMEALEETLGVQAGQTTADALFTLESVRCLGCCASGPVVMVNRETHGGIDRNRAARLIQQYKERA